MNTKYIVEVRIGAIWTTIKDYRQIRTARTLASSMRRNGDITRIIKVTREVVE